MDNEIHELNDSELDTVSGGGWFDDAYEWLASKVRSDTYYDPVKACPQCYAGGGGGARG